MAVNWNGERRALPEPGSDLGHRWSNQLEARESLAIAAPVAAEQGDPLHQGMGADQKIRQHGLARTASGPVFGVSASGQEGGLAGMGRYA